MLKKLPSLALVLVMHVPMIAGSSGTERLDPCALGGTTGSRILVDVFVPLAPACPKSAAQG